MPTVPPEGEDGKQQAIVADREGVIRRWDGECANVFGHSSEEALGQSLDLIVPPALQARHWRGFDRAINTGQFKRPGATLKLPAVHKSGAIISIEISDAAFIRAEDGTVDGVSLTPSKGPAWVAAVFRPVLALLNLGRAVGDRIRPAR
jgi:PAS domain S-box-containing protein